MILCPRSCEVTVIQVIESNVAKVTHRGEIDFRNPRTEYVVGIEEHGPGVSLHKT